MQKTAFERAREIIGEIYEINEYGKREAEHLTRVILECRLLSDAAKSKLVSIITNDVNIDGKIAELNREFESL